MRAHSARSSQFRLLLVMPNHQLVRKGIEMGIRIWSLWDSSQLDADLRQHLEEVSEELLLTDFTDESGLRELIARTTRTHDIDVVLHCGHGSSVLPVVREAWRLGLTPNSPEVYERLQVCESDDRIPAEAPRVSVETLTVDGAHHVIGMTAQRTTGPPDFHVTGHLHPAPLDEEVQKVIAVEVVDLLTASGYRSGPAHTQVALLPLGPRIVSCRAHLGGDRIPLLIDIARGFDPEAAVFAGLLGSRPVVAPASRYAEVGFFLLPEGRLETYTGTEEIAVTSWVRGARFPYRSGDWIAPVGDQRNRRAYVVVEGDTPELTRVRVADARRDLITHIRPAGR
ncbi:phosphoribosylglycinamide synthetase [Streptomyces sp. QHH-9511]|uniref:phosphoribosylglycinamide synthetase n=1 Tax=Streptomyces sp. QHH-9511 TaxID=2684468 RepID=UPI001315D8E3|nr:phosphoribosylglycinamide synthetase [Streptomyces sp. QHH-9511]QGZ50757.1 phosphoribosylglycinamide synthetase [Streptomyces sp. QHH-9511]